MVLEINGSRSAGCVPIGKPPGNLQIIDHRSRMDKICLDRKRYLPPTAATLTGLEDEARNQLSAQRVSPENVSVSKFETREQ